MAKDKSTQLGNGEVPVRRKVRIQTLRCYPLVAVIADGADTAPLAVIPELFLKKTPEVATQGTGYDGRAQSRMKKRDGRGR